MDEQLLNVNITEQKIDTPLAPLPEQKKHRNRSKEREQTQRKTKNKVMVCVTRQHTCARLIAYGADLASKMGAGLLVAHALRPDAAMFELSNEGAALEYLTNLTYGHDGEMSVIRCEDAFAGLATCASENQVDMVILGSSPQNAQDVSNRMRKLLPEASIIVVDASGKGERSEQDTLML